jgi:DNA-binding MarR family transcriptional regulator
MLICKILEIEKEIKQSSFQSNLHKAVVNVIYTEGWISSVFRDIFKNYKITSQQYNVLRILRGRFPATLNPSEIKSVMIDKNPDLTRLCDRLVIMGLIDRCIDEENKRKVNIKINEKGLTVLKEIDPIMSEFTNQKFHLNENEAELLSGLLDKLRG